MNRVPGEEHSGEVIFVLGAARSGKSIFAERLASTFGRNVLYVATMEPLDDETRQRIQLHQQRRPETWSTREAPIEVAEALTAATSYDARVLDCLTLWVSNQLIAAEKNGLTWESVREQVLAATDRLLSTRTTHSEPLIIVSNEVGAGVVPEYQLGRRFRDLVGEVNQRVANISGRLYGLWAGHYLELKSLGARSIEDPPE